MFYGIKNVCLFILFFALNISAQNLFINEFQASNTSTITDPSTQQFSDWIELYNAADTTIDISGFYLTDNLSDPLKWKIAEGTSIRPHKYYLFWADGSGIDRHTNFKLSADGEQIGLFGKNGDVIDSLTYGMQYENNSFGRFPDGSETWYFFNDPTPASANLSQGHFGILPDPVFNLESGAYPSGTSIGITHPLNDAEIHYTTDGSAPTVDATLYTGEFTINKTTVIRAKAFKDNYLSGNSVTATYLVDENINLPVVSIVTDPENLWSDEYGIYVEGTNGIPGYCVSEPRNWNQEWERPAHITYFEKNGQKGFELDAGIQIGGGCTRKYPQKTLAIYTRDIYGTSKINYKLFDDKNIYQFNNFILRNSGQDWYRALFRDGLIQTVVKGKMDIDWQAYKPGVVFLNGEYWGIHGIREKHNEHYFESNYGLDPDKLDILTGDAVVKNGDADHYNNLINFITENDLTKDENYNYVKTQMEISSYLDYVITEIYCANIDWPAGNIKYWRPKTANGRWRWLIYDTDLSFGAHGLGQYDSNNLANATSPTSTYYANPSWSTFLLRSLLTNQDFRNNFIQRFAMHMATTFEPGRVLTIVDSLKNQIADQIPRHKDKWEDSMSFGPSWESLVSIIVEFAQKRPEYVFSQIAEKFTLEGTVNLSIENNNPDGGLIYICDVPLSGNLSADFFKNVPFSVKAVANAGYQFAGWQGLSQEQNDSITVSLNSSSALTALFEKTGTGIYEGLCINEIQALNNNTIKDRFGDNDDWIELYNNGSVNIDISGLYITDDLENPGKYSIPPSSGDSTIIKPGEFLLLWADDELAQGVLHLPFKLSGSGEAIGLYEFTDNTFECIDSVVFGPQTDDMSFGRYPDGSAVLKSFDIASPGTFNIKPTAIREGQIFPVGTFVLQNTPNPFNNITGIEFNLKQPGTVSIVLYDILGNKVDTILQKRFETGAHKIHYNASNLTSGIYFYHFRTGSYSQIRKLLLLK